MDGDGPPCVPDRGGGPLPFNQVSQPGYPAGRVLCEGDRMSEPGQFVGVVTAEVVGHAEHPAELTPEERAHLGLPAEEDQQEEGR